MHRDEDITFFPMPIGKNGIGKAVSLTEKDCQAGATLQTHSLQDHICGYIFLAMQQNPQNTDDLLGLAFSCFRELI